MDLDTSGVDAALEAIKARKFAAPEDALENANHLVAVIAQLIEKNWQDENKDLVVELYKKAADAYVFASTHFTGDNRAKIAFPANYWTMRARHTQQIGLNKINLTTVISEKTQKTIGPHETALNEGPTIYSLPKKELRNTKSFDSLGIFKANLSKSMNLDSNEIHESKETISLNDKLSNKKVSFKINKNIGFESEKNIEDISRIESREKYSPFGLTRRRSICNLSASTRHVEGYKNFIEQ